MRKKPLSSNQSKILCLGTTPAAQRVMIFPRVVSDAVNRAVKTLDGAAGKSVNVAKVLKALGASPVAVGFLGGVRGQQLRAHLEERGLTAHFVSVDAPTRECVTVIDRAAGTITELVEESRPVPSAAYEQLLASVEEHLPGCRALVMCGTIASGGPTDLYLRCTEMARGMGALSILDASGVPLIEALQAGPDLVKPNRPELQATVGYPLNSEEALQRAMLELQARGARRVVVTAGGEPAWALDREGFWKIQAPSIQVVNPIGSGDAFTAALTHRWVCGDAFPDACRWAAAAGAANALTEMAGEVNLVDVQNLLAQTRVEKAH